MSSSRSVVATRINAHVPLAACRGKGWAAQRITNLGECETFLGKPTDTKVERGARLRHKRDGGRQVRHGDGRVASQIDLINPRKKTAKCQNLHHNLRAPLITTAAHNAISLHVHHMCFTKCTAGRQSFASRSRTTPSTWPNQEVLAFEARIADPDAAAAALPASSAPRLLTSGALLSKLLRVKHDIGTVAAACSQYNAAAAEEGGGSMRTTTKPSSSVASNGDAGDPKVTSCAQNSATRACTSRLTSPSKVFVVAGGRCTGKDGSREQKCENSSHHTPALSSSVGCSSTPQGTSADASSRRDGRMRGVDTTCFWNKTRSCRVRPEHHLCANAPPAHAPHARWKRRR